MKAGVVVGIEIREEDQTGCAGDGEEDAQCTKYFLYLGCVGCQSAVVAEPAFSDESQVKRDYHHAGAGDEERL